MSIDKTHSKLSAHAERELCVAIPCDPRTLRRYLNGEAVNELRRIAIERVLRERGLPLGGLTSDDADVVVAAK